jgi:hypothetical protein
LDAEPLGLLDDVVAVEVVDDEHEVAGDARHLVDRRLHVGEVMRRDPGHDQVEAAVGEREMLGA